MTHLQQVYGPEFIALHCPLVEEERLVFFLQICTFNYCPQDIFNLDLGFVLHLMAGQIRTIILLYV